MITRPHQTSTTNGEKSKRELALEKRYGKIALNWVEQQNKKTLQQFTTSQEFKDFHDQLLTVKRQQYPDDIIGNYLYNFTKNRAHQQGVWRRTTVSEYQKPEPTWEILLDMDALPEKETWQALLPAKKMTENPQGSWVWQKVVSSGTGRHMIGLSYGGEDDCIFREFDENKKSFVKNGFTLRCDDDAIIWRDPNSLFIVDTDPHRITQQGYLASVIRLWKRGESLNNARIVYREKDDNDLYAEIMACKTTYAPSYHLITRHIDHIRSEFLKLNEHDFSLSRINIPSDATLNGFISQSAIFTLSTAWKCKNGIHYKANSVLSIDLNSPQLQAIPKIDVIFETENTCMVNSINVIGNEILVDVLNNVKGEIYHCYWNRGWKKFKLPLPAEGKITIISDQERLQSCFIRYEDFLTPATDYCYDLTTKKIKMTRQNPAYFDASNMIAHQYWATSLDGTAIPYFAVHEKTLSYNGMNPTILHGYGGFKTPELPRYLTPTGKFWLEKGGVYLLANIRGGGEFGAQWHQAALKTNRHKSFEDFIAIAEDAIKRGITSPKYLGIRGSSNGGLLVAVAFTQRPELFTAVMCDVPLLDMLNYATPELGGDRWINEYGDPKDPATRRFLKSYSPYHHVFPNKHYPEILFLSSTADDRVHPAHARNMVYRMAEQGHVIHYYESKEGGHSGNVNLTHEAFEVALIQSFFHQKLMLPKLMLSLTPSTRAAKLTQRYSLFQTPKRKLDQTEEEATVSKKKKLS